MKKISFALVGAASLALAACGGHKEEATTENVVENYDAATDNLEAVADEGLNTAEAAAPEATVNAAETTAAPAETVDEADASAAEVNAM